jgi:hypothetical protein
MQLSSESTPCFAVPYHADAGHEMSSTAWAGHFALDAQFIIQSLESNDLRLSSDGQAGKDKGQERRH